MIQQKNAHVLEMNVVFDRSLFCTHAMCLFCIARCVASVHSYAQFYCLNRFKIKENVGKGRVKKKNCHGNATNAWMNNRTIKSNKIMILIFYALNKFNESNIASIICFLHLILCALYGRTHSFGGPAPPFMSRVCTWMNPSIIIAMWT